MNGADAVDDRIEVQALVVSLKSALPELEQLLYECNGQWGYEDPIYRFYHQSFKVYALGRTMTISTQCTRRDLNPHALRRRNLNPVRLPIPPLVLDHESRRDSARKRERLPKVRGKET